MDENIVFNNQQQTSQPSASSQPVSSPPSGNAGENPPTPPTTPPAKSVINTMSKELLLKIGIGIGIFFVFVIFFMLISSLLGGKISSGKVTIQVWGLWESQNVMNAVIADFEKKYPNIKVEYQQQDAKQYRDKLTTRIKNGNGPDIFVYHNTWLPMIADIVSPLPQTVIQPDEFNKIYYPVIQHDLVKNGAIYGIPMGIDTLSLFINKDMFSPFNPTGPQVPATWEDFDKVSKQLTVKDTNGRIQTAGAALGTYDNITHAPDIISMMLAQLGVDFNKLTTSTQNISDTFNFYTHFAKGDNSVWDPTLDNSLLAFSRGKLAMYIGYSWDIFAIQALNKDINFKIYPIPSLPGSNATIASYWVQGVSMQSQHQKEAFTFMNYMTQKDTSQLIYAEESKVRLFGEPYARVDLANTLKGNDLVYPFVQQASSAKSSYFASDTHDGDGGLNSSLNTYLGNAINSIVNDNSSTQTVVDTLLKGTVQVGQKYAN